MNVDYFIRCKESDKPALLEIARQLGVLRLDGGQWVSTNTAWVWEPIGRIYKDVDNKPVVSTAPDGSPYWHANLRITQSLYELATAVYAQRPTPELAAGLADFSRFFFTDPETGEATRPADPAVIFL